MKLRALQVLLGGLLLIGLFGCGGGGGGAGPDGTTGISPMEVEVQSVVNSFISRLNAAAANPATLALTELDASFVCLHVSSPAPLTHTKFSLALQNFFNPANTASASIVFAPITVYPLGEFRAKAFGTLSYSYFDQKAGVVKNASDSAQFELELAQTWKIVSLSDRDFAKPVTFPPLF